MHLTVTYPSDDGGQLELQGPMLGALSEIVVNGKPESTTSQRVALEVTGRVVEVDYLLRGALERYEDGIVVTVPVWAGASDADNKDKRLPIDGTLLMGGRPSSTVHWHGAAPADVTVDGQTVRFHGEVGTKAESQISFVLPAGAAPDAPLLHGKSLVPTFEEKQQAKDAGDAHLREDLRADERRENIAGFLYWLALALEIAIPLIVWAARRRFPRRLVVGAAVAFAITAIPLLANLG